MCKYTFNILILLAFHGLFERIYSPEHESQHGLGLITVNQWFKMRLNRFDTVCISYSCFCFHFLKERKILEETVAPLTPSSPLLSSPCYEESAPTQNNIIRDWEHKQVEMEKQMVRKDEEIYNMHGKRSGMRCTEGLIGRCMVGHL